MLLHYFSSPAVLQSLTTFRKGKQRSINSRGMLPPRPADNFKALRSMRHLAALCKLLRCLVIGARLGRQEVHIADHRP